MMNHRSLALALCTGAVLALSACATQPAAPAKDQQHVSLIHSLNWTNGVTGKPDGARSSWPLATLRGHKETFPLAQIKQCDQAGACAFGIMSAARTVEAWSPAPGGVGVELALAIDIDRSQHAREPGLNTTMTIPANVQALRWKGEIKRSFVLVFGAVQHIDLDYGISFDVCAIRYDAAGQALDVCDILYL
jgi:hypothetical protein